MFLESQDIVLEYDSANKAGYEVTDQILKRAGPAGLREDSVVR